MYCLRLRSDSEEEFAEVAAQLDKAIQDSVRGAPRVFISHRHIDEPNRSSLD
jgi:hypothetical protein